MRFSLYTLMVSVLVFNLCAGFIRTLYYHPVLVLSVCGAIAAFLVGWVIVIWDEPV